MWKFNQGLVLCYSYSKSLKVYRWSENATVGFHGKMIYAGSHSPEHLVDLWISSSKIYQEKKFMGRPSVHTFSTRGEFRQEKKCRGKKKREERERG